MVFEDRDVPDVISVALVAVGLLTAIPALVHGYLGEVRIVRRSECPDRQSRALMSMIWQLNIALWFVAGLVYATSPWLLDDTHRLGIVALASLPIVWGIVGNFVATSGRHLGWILFLILVASANTLAYASS